ncbi:2-dehydro-3-deoxy-6-phosphogalactonate aldolase [Marinimicrobium alkaliphilum]|uniref:2-dehydro-3-deoxy-6-phosphogalactonate aldolase n=1 Tax=Marinimicrobium alkaliphilum TaxID=2202654 RepID=UPI000DB95B38|nr:2-dehydro-3-deoxy-6-phosphogalactonate aldolase [Marinimicrobium alkaliphilum]
MQTVEWQNHWQRLPLVAILRGIAPDEVPAVAQVLHEAGISLIEVPITSPRALESVAQLHRLLGERIVAGAGTVTEPEQLAGIARAGGRLTVSPHCDPALIGAGLRAGLQVVPGVATPTEAFAAYRAGARFLKLFPASSYGIDHVRQLRTVLPDDVKLLAVGGVSVDNMPAYWHAGCAGFGMGSELYRPGDTAQQVADKAQAMVTALRALMA